MGFYKAAQKNVFSYVKMVILNFMNHLNMEILWMDKSIKNEKFYLHLPATSTNTDQKVNI